MRASILLGLLALGGCRRAPAAIALPETALSMVSAADPAAAGQLVEGFYGVETGGWRWTGKRFRAVVRPPAGAAERGAILRIDLTLPKVLLQAGTQLTVSCDVDGSPRVEQRYDSPGKYSLTRELPTPIASSGVAITCGVDPSYKPGGSDIRELGVIVSSIGLDPR